MCTDAEVSTRITQIVEYVTEIAKMFLRVTITLGKKTIVINLKTKKQTLQERLQNCPSCTLPLNITDHECVSLPIVHLI